MNGYTGPARRYIVARANRTAMAFVAKTDKEREGYIILYRTDDYGDALMRRDSSNLVIRRTQS